MRGALGWPVDRPISSEGAHAVSTFANVGRWAALVAAVLLLNQSLTFYNIWPTPKIRWQGHVSIELAACVLLLIAATALVGRVSKVGLRALAALWVTLVVGRYAETVAPALYGREINLFWDVRHLSAVTAMMADSASSRVVLAVTVGAMLGLAVLYAAARWALGRVADAAAGPVGAIGTIGPVGTIGAVGTTGQAGLTGLWPRRVLGAGAAGLVALFIGQQAGVLASAVPGFSPLVSKAYAHQARILFTQLTTRHTPTLASRQSTGSDLARVRGADVYLVFVESYGAVSYDRPAFTAGLAPARAAFDAAVRDTGREVVSAFVDSPTFGGSSWLAHVSLMTGVEARDEDTNVVLMAQQRDTLVTTFARRGYRTVALMPGLRQQWPEGAFYGFDHIYDTKQLDYRGPRFGWWTVPDQFALARLDVLEAASAVASASPRFVFFPTTSTHAPFGPTAPYQPDWQRVVSEEPYDKAEVERALALKPQYFDLGPGYVRAVSYAYASIGGYLRQHPDRDFVMVMLGDHQPAAAVTGEGATWEVPVHIIASRPEVLDALRARGFRSGLTPQRPRLGPMQDLLPTLLDAFGKGPEKQLEAIGSGLTRRSRPTANLSRARR
jgi:hypothetical protein